MTEIPFERTSCSCSGCVSYCRKQPGPLIPADIERIGAVLRRCNRCSRFGVSDEDLPPCECGGIMVRVQLENFLCASKGAKVLDIRTGQIRWIRTITPKMHKNACVFLTKDSKCSIHPVAPFGCSYFDDHMSAEEGQRRSVFAHTLIDEDKEYSTIRTRLPLSQNYRMNR